MISPILYRRTLKKALPHFIQTKDLAMSANIIMASAFHSASSNDIILCYSETFHAIWISYLQDTFFPQTFQPCIASVPPKYPSCTVAILLHLVVKSFA
jgi:hypothetical protein